MKNVKTNYCDIAELVQDNFRQKLYFHIENLTHYKVKLKFMEFHNNIIHCLGEYHNSVMYERGVTWASYTKLKSYKF